MGVRQAAAGCDMHRGNREPALRNRAAPGRRNPPADGYAALIAREDAELSRLMGAIGLKKN